MTSDGIIFADDLDDEPDTIYSLRQEIVRLTADRDDWMNICAEQTLMAEEAEAEVEHLTKELGIADLTNDLLEKRVKEANNDKTLPTRSNHGFPAHCVMHDCHECRSGAECRAGRAKRRDPWRPQSGEACQNECGPKQGRDRGLARPARRRPAPPGMHRGRWSR